MSKTRVHDIEIAYDDEGAGPPVVLLHGYPFNRSMWADQTQALRNSQRVIVPDLRGHGESEVAAATIEAMARDIGALMTSIGISEAAICGLSMGGYIALAFYRLFPERVRALVSTEPRGRAVPVGSKKNRKRQANGP